MLSIAPPPRYAGSNHERGFQPSSSTRPLLVETGTNACITKALRRVQGPTASATPSSSSATFRLRSPSPRASPSGTHAHSATTAGSSSATGRARASSPQIKPRPSARPRRGVFTQSALSRSATSSSRVKVFSVRR
ncbi:MAG: hypothetical protein A2V63_04855 [Candidatus Eisenbacteria bacterium RBG_19FT_COMBO_70_11]|nr:MAG: hypothetical protein A2V63_04855 [Candidatus Eisenbacteria bacterium RBG_19FT_COMBO_70_11]